MIRRRARAWLPGLLPLAAALLAAGAAPAAAQRRGQPPRLPATRGGPRSPAVPRAVTPQTPEQLAETRRRLAQLDYQQALVLLRQEGDEARALQLLERSFGEDETYAPPRYALATLLEAKGERERAMTLYEEFIALSPDSPLAPTARLWLDEYRQGALAPSAGEAPGARYDAALAAAKSALAARQPLQAAAIAHQAAQLERGRWEAPALEGAALGEAGLFAEGANLLRAALARAPAGPRSTLQAAAQRCDLQALARERAAAGAAASTDQAAAAFDRAAALLPAREDFVVAAAGAWLAAGELDRAVRLLADAGGLMDPAQRATGIALRDQLEAARREQEALASPLPSPGTASPGGFDRAIAESGAAARGAREARSERAANARRAREHELAAEALRASEAIQKDPKSSSHYAWLTAALLGQGERGRAEKVLAEHLKVIPGEAERLGVSAWFRVCCRVASPAGQPAASGRSPGGSVPVGEGEPGPPEDADARQALAMALRSIELDPRSGELRLTLGLVYYRLGDYPRAMERIAEAATMRESRGDRELCDLYVLAMCSQRLGDRERARQLYEEAEAARRANAARLPGRSRIEAAWFRQEAEVVLGLRPDS